MNVHSLDTLEPVALMADDQTLSNAPPRPREYEILDNIRHTFAEKGFDGASMQDLARAAGMSVGNFYRYFPSKAAMVEAISPTITTRYSPRYFSAGPVSSP